MRNNKPIKRRVRNNLIEVLRDYVSPSGIQIKATSRLYMTNQDAERSVSSGYGRRVSESLGSQTVQDLDILYSSN